MAVEQHVTYCRICEALCGMIATVEDGRLQALRPDPDNPLSHPPRGPGVPKKPGRSEPETTAREPDEIRDRGDIPKGAA